MNYDDHNSTQKQTLRYVVGPSTKLSGK